MKRFLFILLFIPILIFGQDRIKYIENKGQWNGNSLYKTDLENGAAYFESNSVRFNFYDPTKIDHLHVNSSKAVSDIVDFYAYDLLFVNSNAGSNVLANNILGGYSNYFIGSDRRKWKHNVKSYKSITYLSLYDGIDCEFYSSGDFLKYDFIISPKHDPSLIKLKYSGVDVQKDRESILIDLGFNKIYESKPIAYQIIDGEQIDVECTYVLKNNVVSFDFPNGFDDNYNLIIDPVLITATLSGSMASDTWGHSATYDPMGNIYTGARCFSSGYPTTTGAYQLNYGRLY